MSKDYVTDATQAYELQHLDTKPFIRTFESTLRELKQLSTEAAIRRTALEKEVNKYDLDHSRNILSLSSRTESINTQFKRLDDQIYKANSKINPLTENLTTIINAKERSLATISLIEIYTEFYQKNHSDQLERLVHGSIVDKRKCATNVAQLISLSQKLISEDLKNSSTCHDSIQKYSETMENSLLLEFDNEYKSNNVSKMKDIADILTDYNGGIAVIKNFVSQNKFFLSESIFDDDDLIKDKIWDGLSDPENHHGLPLSYIEPLFKQIDEALRDETITILEVFRDPITVIGSFIQRVFAQQIQSRIESLLTNAYSSSNLAYLRTLYTLYISTGNFSKDLKAFFQTHLESQHQSKLEELNSIIDQSYGDLFIQHLGDMKYFEAEKKTLESIFLNLTTSYEQVNDLSITGKLQAKLLSQTTNLPESGVNEYESLNRRRRVGQQVKNFMKSHLDRSTSFKRSNSMNGFNEASNEKELKLSKRLDLKIVESLLKSTVESLSRVLELAPEKTSEYSLEILEILLLGIGKSYVDLGLEVSYNDLNHQDNKSDTIDLDYLFNVDASSDILYLISFCIKTIFLPLSNNSTHLRQKILNLTNSYVSRVEMSINIIIKETLSKAHDKVQSALSKQKRKDYLATDLLETDTVACTSLCKFLNEFHDQVIIFLNNGNLTSILEDLGNFTFKQLFEHYKNYQINSTGGIVVTKDIISYQQTIENWKIQSVSENFSLLREIANLFTVQPELINALTKEGYLANIKPYILRQFISKRSDYTTNTNYLDKLRSII